MNSLEGLEVVVLPEREKPIEKGGEGLAGACRETCSDTVCLSFADLITCLDKGTDFPEAEFR